MDEMVYGLVICKVQIAPILGKENFAVHDSTVDLCKGPKSRARLRINVSWCILSLSGNRIIGGISSVG